MNKLVILILICACMSFAGATVLFISEKHKRIALLNYYLMVIGVLLIISGLSAFGTIFTLLIKLYVGV